MNRVIVLVGGAGAIALILGLAVFCKLLRDEE